MKTIVALLLGGVVGAVLARRLVATPSASPSALPPEAGPDRVVIDVTDVGPPPLTRWREGGDGQSPSR